MNLPGTDIPLDGPYPFDPNKPPQPFDGLMVATVHDLESFWAEQMPAVFGKDYVPLAGGVFPAYPERTDYPPNGCITQYSDVEANGFYCPDGDYITWDDVGYALDGYTDHGSGAITGLMSHEWGHAIQQRTGVFDIVPEVSTPVVELQADCYSGAWFAHIARGESTLLSFTDADIRSGLLDTALSADPVGSSPTDEEAHGAGFDRVGAFQDGFNLGVTQCAGYPEHNPPITEFPFDSTYGGDQDPGNAPYDSLVLGDDTTMGDIPTDLNTYWTQTLPDSFTPLTITSFNGEPPACDGLTADSIKQTLAVYCASTGDVLVNDSAARTAVDRVGDFAAGYFLAAAWAEAAQISVDSKLSGVKRVLYDDCFVGVWAKSLPTDDTGPDDRLLEISPGDLDEAIATAILLADDSADVGLNGDAYQKVDAFRHGALGGISGCNTYFSS
ncbi:MAG: hypothetical protein JWN39_1457 [Ilumatobacteraceae bacterium]|nr:hypothetical protein [Ilumatobacteraceae bacterium]